MAKVICASVFLLAQSDRLEFRPIAGSFLVARRIVPQLALTKLFPGGNWAILSGDRLRPMLNREDRGTES